MQKPDLPGDLELVHVPAADSARAEAIRRARAGAEEGTLVWVEGPSAPVARHGAEWLVPDDPGLHAALVLRPGLPAEECAELASVVAVAIGRALGALVEPMTELHYRWPNDVLLNYGKVAGVWLDGEGSPEALDWLVISWAINTNVAPDSLGHAAAALAREGRISVADPGELLQVVARELLASIATWDESGFDSILRAWRPRLVPGEVSGLRLADGSVVEGEFEGVDEAGAAQVRSGDATRSIPLNAFFGLPGVSA